MWKFEGKSILTVKNLSYSYLNFGVEKIIRNISRLIQKSMFEFLVVSFVQIYS